MSIKVKLTTYKMIKRGNWWLRFSATDQGSVMLIAMSVIAEYMFIKYFSSEEDAASFVDFLVLNQDYTP